MLKAVKVRLYPTSEQELALAKSFGCARWYWNFALNACIQHYQETGKSLKLATYKGMLPQLKKEYPWLKEDCYSSVLQCIAINLDKAYKNFFERRAKFPRFQSKHHKQSIQYPQSVTVNGEYLKVPKIGEIKAVFHRNGAFYLEVSYELEKQSHKLDINQALSIDLGTADNLATCVDTLGNSLFYSIFSLSLE